MLVQTVSRGPILQVTLASSFLEEESNMEGLSDVLGSLISAQVAGKVVGEVADELPSDYFRLSTGIYDAATVGAVQARIGKSGRTLTLYQNSAHPIDYSKALSTCEKISTLHVHRAETMVDAGTHPPGINVRSSSGTVLLVLIESDQIH